MGPDNRTHKMYLKKKKKAKGTVDPTIPVKNESLGTQVLEDHELLKTVLMPLDPFNNGPCKELNM